MGEGQPVDRPAPAPTPALDLTHSGPFPLSAVTSARLPPVTFAPRIIRRQGQDIMPTAAGPAPDHPGPPGTTNKVTGGISEQLSMLVADSQDER